MSNIRKQVNRSANYNRIHEMNNARMGVNQIAGVFLDNGQKLSPEFIRLAISNDAEMTRTALPKRRARDAIKAHNLIDSPDIVLAT